PGRAAGERAAAGARERRTPAGGTGTHRRTTAGRARARCRATAAGRGAGTRTRRAAVAPATGTGPQRPATVRDDLPGWRRTLLRDRTARAGAGLRHAGV